MNAPTIPSQLLRPCPGCGKEVHLASLRCKHCGHQLRKRAKAKPRKKVEVKPEGPEFAAGLTIAGDLMLMWPQSEESVTLKTAEVELLRRVLNAALPAAVD